MMVKEGMVNCFALRSAGRWCQHFPQKVTAQGRRLSYLQHIIEGYFPDVHYIESSNEDSDTDSMLPLEDID